MKFSELITKLHSASQPHMLMYIDIRSDCELVDVNILASGQSDVQAGTLYFADAGQLTPDTVLPTNLLYYGTLPPELADRLTNSAMIDRGEFAVLFQTVKELLSYQQSDQQLYTQVLYMLCNGAELDRVLTKMTDVTGDLFVVIDSTGKLVAKTKNFYVDYPLWMRSIEQGYCSDILMEYIEDRRRKNEYSLSDKPFTLFCEHMQRYLLCTRIVYDNFMMGYVIIVSKTGMFSAAEQQIIPLLSSSAKERIVRSNNGNWIDYRASQLNNIFADMLAGTQNVDMERRMKLAKLSFPEQKCLAIIRPVYYKEPAYYKSRLIPDMQAIFGKTAFSVVKNDLVLLLTAADGGTITPEQRAALEQYTQGHRLIVGISNCFQANNQLSLHYNMLLQTCNWPSRCARTRSSSFSRTTCITRCSIRSRTKACCPSSGIPRSTRSSTTTAKKAPSSTRRCAYSPNAALTRRTPPSGSFCTATPSTTASHRSNPSAGSTFRRQSCCFRSSCLF